MVTTSRHRSITQYPHNKHSRDMEPPVVVEGWVVYQEVGMVVMVHSDMAVKDKDKDKGRRV